MHHTHLEDIEKAVAELPEAQLRKFRAWYEKFDADRWDAKIERDALSKKLDGIAGKALSDHKAGKSKPL